LLIWKCWTEELLTNRKYQGGDLARMGYIYGSKHFRTSLNTDLPRRHMHINDYDGRKIDMLTVGDSFSNGGAGGNNRFYQDYIASINKFEVLNIPRHKNINPLSTVSIFTNNGFIDKLKPRYVLVSIDEKGTGEMAAPVDFLKSLTEEQLREYKRFDYETSFPNPPLINNGNLKFIIYNLLYNFSDHAVFGNVYIKKISLNLFSVPNANKLLFLRYKRQLTTDEIQSLNNNLNQLADLLAIKGVVLVFMPCVDKFNLYSDYIVNNPYPRSTFFEELRKLPKRYRFIDTKAILAEELRRGEKDIYYADDTHWSWKASKKIFENIKFE
jgi:hypothetical protein